MCSAPRARCRGIRDCAWGCVTPVCGVWVARVVTLLMFSAPLGRGRSVRDYVQGYVRPACELWMSRVVSPRYVFGTLGTKTGRVRLRVGLSEACVRGARGACGAPRYVFGAFGARSGRARLRVGLCEACVRGVGARVGTLVVLLHDLRACHSAYASGLVSQGGWRETAPYLNFQAPNCHFPAHPLVSCAFGVVFGSSLPTIYLLRPYETPPRTGYFAECFSFPLNWQATSSIC